MKVMTGGSSKEIVGDAKESMNENSAIKLYGNAGNQLIQKISKEESKYSLYDYKNLFSFFSVDLLKAI